MSDDLFSELYAKAEASIPKTDEKITKNQKKLSGIYFKINMIEG